MAVLPHPLYLLSSRVARRLWVHTHRNRPDRGGATLGPTVVGPPRSFQETPEPLRPGLGVERPYCHRGTRIENGVEVNRGTFEGYVVGPVFYGPGALSTFLTPNLCVSYISFFVRFSPGPGPEAPVSVLTSGRPLPFIPCPLPTALAWDGGRNG